MFKRFVRDAAVKLFGLAAKLGIQRLPMFDRVFLALYATYKRQFEAGPTDRLKEFVSTGSLVIDVGANVGFFSVRFAQWVGDNGKVISIEPEDRNFQHLTSAVKREGLVGRVRLLKAVAAAAPGTMLLEINRLHPADHKISRDGTGLAVTAVTLDELVGDSDVPKPSLIKIDVQGAEMMVLKGANGILKNSKPALFIELQEEGLNRFDSSVTELLNHLSQFGYQAYWLARAGAHAKASQADIRAKVEQNGYVDVLFLNEN